MIPALLFGGAFSPPTIAHIKLAEHAKNCTGRDCVIFVPSKNSYIRDTQHKSFAFSDEERLRMLEKCAETREWMKVSDWEIRREKQPRTYETLCHLKEEGYQCSLLFGTDKLCELEHEWLYVDEIAHEFGMTVIARGGDNPEEMIADDPYLRTLRPYMELVPALENTKHVSSTHVRNELNEILNHMRAIRQIVPKELTGMILDYAEGELDK